MKIKLLLLLLTLFAWLQYSLWFGRNGINDLIQIKHDMNVQRQKNHILKKCNNKLRIEINYLNNNNNEIIEEYSRIKLDMVKFNEIFYFLPLEQQLDNKAINIVLHSEIE